MPSNLPEEVHTTVLSENPVRTPNVMATDNYLDDTIEFIPDYRFVENSILRFDNTVLEAQRDISNFVVIDPADTDHNSFRVEMISKKFDREKIYAKINKEFSELIRAQ